MNYYCHKWFVYRAVGANFNNVVKATVLLKDINDFQKVNEVYKEFFKAPHEPARAAYQVDYANFYWSQSIIFIKTKIRFCNFQDFPQNIP